MKIMFITDCNLSGGAERVVSLLCNYFSSAGNDVTLMNFDRDSNFYYINPAVHIIKLEKKYPAISCKKRIVKRLLINKYARKELLLNRPDIAIPFLFDAEFAIIPCCIKNKIPCITSVRNDANVYPHYQRIFRKKLYPKIAGIVFQSKAVWEHEDYCKLDNACVIPNPISVIPLEKRDVPINQNKIISVGRLSRQKNHEMTIRAVADLLPEYPSLELYIFGEGSEKSSLEQLISALGVNDHVHLEGVVDNAQGNNRDARAFVMASNYEGFPNALLEAMAYHIPVICTDFSSGTAAEALDNGSCGWLVPVGDEEMLKAAIKDCFDNLEKSEAKADKAIEQCKKYDIDTIGNMWQSFITKSIGIK